MSQELREAVKKLKNQKRKEQTINEPIARLIVRNRSEPCIRTISKLLESPHQSKPRSASSSPTRGKGAMNFRMSENEKDCRETKIVPLPWNLSELPIPNFYWDKSRSRFHISSSSDQNISKIMRGREENEAIEESSKETRLKRRRAKENEEIKQLFNEWKNEE